MIYLYIYQLFLNKMKIKEINIKITDGCFVKKVKHESK